MTNWRKNRTKWEVCWQRALISGYFSEFALRKRKYFKSEEKQGSNSEI